MFSFFALASFEYANSVFGSQIDPLPVNYGSFQTRNDFYLDFIPLTDQTYQIDADHTLEYFKFKNKYPNLIIYNKSFVFSSLEFNDKISALLKNKYHLFYENEVYRFYEKK